MRASLAGFPSCFLLVSLLISSTALAAGFVENRGQLDDRVLFYAPGAGGTVYLTADALVFDLREPGGFASPPNPSGEPAAPAPVRGCAVYARFVEANPAPVIEGRGLLETRFHFFRGNDPAAWRTDVPVFDEIVYRGVWPGVDLVFRTEAGRVVYEVLGAAGADPGRARFIYEGATAVATGEDGATILETPFGTLEHDPAVAGAREGTFGREGRGRSGAAKTNDDSSSLEWSTFFGGTDYEYARSIVLDFSENPDGNPVVGGGTCSAVFPTTPGAYDSTHAGPGLYDIYVAEFSVTGSTLLWCTLLGGSEPENFQDLVLDPYGNVVLAGYTASADFPTSVGAYDRTLGGNNDAFVAKLSSTGSSLVWSTFLGGSADEFGYGLALDPFRCPIVTGVTASADFPTTTGAYDIFYGDNQDVFVTRLASNGTSLLWSTFLGGMSFEGAYDIALDSLANPVVTGWTHSTNYPVTNGAYDTSPNGATDVFVTKLAGNGSSLLWSTFLGSTGDENAYAVALDAHGNPVLAGWTRSGAFPVTAGAYDTSPNGLDDAFVAKLSADGSSLLWNTFLGGDSVDVAFELELDPWGNPVVTGRTSSDDFPTTAGAYDTERNGGSDVFLARLSGAGSTLLWSTFLGGPKEESGYDLVVDPDGNPLLVGSTASSEFPTTPGAYDTTFGGGVYDQDAFIAKFLLPDPTDVAAAPTGFGVMTLRGEPNPTTDAARLSYILRREATVRLTIYDVRGRAVAERNVGLQAAGSRSVVWDGRNARGEAVPAGVYFARLEAGDVTATRKMLIVR